MRHSRTILAGALAAAAVAWARPSAQVPVFRTGIELVNLGVTVADRKGSLVTDLKVDDFEIYEDGKKQAIRYFAAGERAVLDDELDLEAGQQDFVEHPDDQLVLTDGQTSHQRTNR